MPEHDDSGSLAQEPGEPSKSAVKRQMTALQELGESLTRLSEKQLTNIPVDDDRLLIAIREARAIRSNSARRRHMQYIGKLMRDIDPEPMQKALQAMSSTHRQATDSFHQLEQLREEVLAQGLDGVEKLMARWPHADRQQLRQLVRQHQRESDRGRPPVASRKLFRYLRELQEES